MPVEDFSSNGEQCLNWLSHVRGQAQINISQLWKKRLGDWVINPYIGCQHGCFHCYCPAMPGVKFFNGGRTQEEWGHYLIVKPGIVEATARDLRRLTPEKAKRTKWGRGIILASFLTDPYQAAERFYGITRKIVTLLLEAGHSIRIQTRSDLVERDFDILGAHADRVFLGTSLPYLDDALARRLEPGAPPPSRRLRMLERAGERGIPVYAAVAPFMPWHTTDVLEEIARCVLPLKPVEVFCEVLNRRGKNLAMMRKALSSDAVWLRDYEQSWPAFTAKILTDFQQIFGAVAVPWPDKQAVAKLPEQVAARLRSWLPVQCCPAAEHMDPGRSKSAMRLTGCRAQQLSLGIAMASEIEKRKKLDDAKDHP